MLLLVGCTEQTMPPEGFYTYDHSEIETTLNELSFKPAIPPYLPFKVEFLITDRFTLEDIEKEAIDVSFYSKENDIVTFQATEGSLMTVESGEKVLINKNVKGSYTDNQFAQSLYWKEDGISYSIIFHSGTITEEQDYSPITKEDLIKVAQAI